MCGVPILRQKINGGATSYFAEFFIVGLEVFGNIGRKFSWVNDGACGVQHFDGYYATPRLLGVNCSASVLPDIAAVDNSPALMAFCTASK